MLGRKILIASLFSLILSLPSTAVNYSGSYSIGTSGTWTNLTSAFTAISAGTVTGNVNLILVAGYPAAAETYPIAPSTNNGSYTISIYPGTTGLSITSASATGTINLSGCDNYVIDGRVNQAGAENLVISNTNTSGYVIQFINDADYNTIQYCNIQGVNASLTSGDILFSTAATSGNNYNNILNCDIHDGSTTPYVGICSIGTNTAGQYNNSNTVSNCNIYNFYASSGSAYGIFLSTGNTSWTISGNSLYQTSARIPAAKLNFKPIYINSTGINYLVTGNYVGGSAASCGGSAFSFDAAGSQDSYLSCISIGTGTSVASTVQNNTIANIAFGAKAQTSATTFNFTAISVNSGYVIVTGNTVGSGTGTGSITTAYSASSTVGFVWGGIVHLGAAGSISGNTIGSVTVGGGVGGQVVPVAVDGTLTSDFLVNNNLIGSTSTPNSIQYTSGASLVQIGAFAFEAQGPTINLTVSNNTIENITNSCTNSGGVLVGIAEYLTNCIPTITYNTIAYLNTTIPGVSGLWGIADIEGTATVHTISNNIVHDLNNTYNGATTVNNYGIYLSGPTGTSNIISSNIIYNLNLSSTSVASQIYGIGVLSGAATVANNMITLGNGITTGYVIDGIYQSSGVAGSNYYYNSVYIGGAPTAGSSTNAYYSSVAVARTLENNIFYNARTGGGIKHYAINVSSITGLTSNYNDLYSATDVGNDAGTAEVTLANWQTASVQDANSISSNPTFVSTVTPDLHITSGSSVITKGTSVAAVTVDIDNEPRSSTPDIGADEYHTNYYSAASGNLDVLTNWGLNTDGSGANPPNFTSRDQTFNIRNNTSPTIGSAWVVSGSGSLVIIGDGTNPCNFTIPATFNLTGATLNISNNGTLTDQNTINPTFGVINSGSTVNYNSASGSNQLISNAVYGNLILSNSTGSGASTKSLTSNITIIGNLTINGYATLDMLTYDANRTGGGGTFTIAANGNLRLSGTTGGASATSGGTTSFPKNFSTMSFNSSGTVEYYGATQTIYDIPSYGNLTVTSTTSATAGGSLTISGNLLINSSAVFAASTYTHYIAGNWTNNGTFTPSTGTITFNGTAGETINGTVASQTFSNIVVDLSAGQTLTIGGSTTTLTTTNFTLTTGNFTPGALTTLNVTGNTLLNGGSLTAPATINQTGNWANNGGTFTPGSNVVNFISAAGQTISGTTTSQTFNNIVVNLTAGKLLNTGGSTTTLSVNNLTGTTGNFTAPATLNINGNVTLSAGTFTAGTTINMYGANWTNNGGTFTPGTNTVNFLGTSAQTINGTAVSQTFGNVIAGLTTGQLLSTGGSTVTLTTANLTETSGNITAPATLHINGALTLSSGTFTAGAAITISGNWINNGGTFVPGTNTVTFNGASSQSIQGTASSQTFYNVIGNLTAGQTLSTGGSTATITTQNLTETTGNITAPATLNINGALTLTTGTFTAGPTINITGNWTNNGGTFTPGTNTVNFLGTASQIINGTASTQTFYNIVGNLTAGQSLSTGGSTTTLTTTNLTETTGNITAPATLNITGNLLLTAGTFTAGTTLNISGGFTNNSGNFTQGLNTVVFNGSSAQSLGGSSGTTFYKLTINNTSGGITLGAPVTATNTLSLTSGIIYSTPVNLITMTAGSTVVGGSATSYVDGPIAKIGTTAFVFPTGNNGVWARIAIGAPSTSETFTAQYYNSAYGNYTMATSPTPVLNNISKVEYWTLGRAGSANATVTLYTENTAASGISTCSNTDLRIAHYNTVTNQWENNNNAVTVNLTSGTCGSATGTLNVVTTSAVTNFSPFTFGSLAGINPLPVELTSFSAECDDGAAILKWSTASENNNKYFTLEKTQDGINYTSASVVTGSGNTSTTHNYSATDPSPFLGTSYYRLSQTDYDGNITYFSSIPFQACEATQNISTFVNNNNDICIHINSAGIETYTIEIVNIMGQTMISNQENVSKGENQFTFPDEYSKGVYFIRVSNSIKTYTSKVLLLR